MRQLIVSAIPFPKDPHINKALLDAVKSGLRIYIIDTHTDFLLNEWFAKDCPLMKGVAGIFTGGLWDILRRTNGGNPFSTAFRPMYILPDIV